MFDYRIQFNLEREARILQLHHLVNIMNSEFIWSYESAFPRQNFPWVAFWKRFYPLLSGPQLRLTTLWHFIRHFHGVLSVLYITHSFLHVVSLIYTFLIAIIPPRTIYSCSGCSVEVWHEQYCSFDRCIKKKRKSLLSWSEIHPVCLIVFDV